ncbi:tektin-2 [Cololabis saira]|uniref:tektin-2 n=1 Tax=Cololabis saira TaxID=129043 RepID=UPI002AD44392|nr:tektin-2 [Cololabis saira]
MSGFTQKPGLHHSVSDWHSNNQQLSAAARQERQAAREVKREARSLRDLTSCQTVWDESETRRRLSDRVWDVTRWKEALEACAQEVDKEMEALTLSKQQSEEALAATSVDLEVTAECLALREGRRELELVADRVEEELKTEAALIQRVRQDLQRHIDRAFEQLCILQEARHQLTADLQNKMEALDIDLSCLSLTTQSPQISLKTDPTRIPPGSSTPQEWVQFSQRNATVSQEAVQASQQLREDMSLSRAQLQNEMETQHRATGFALRKRSHHEEQAARELQWQIKKTEDEMAEMESDIHNLDADFQAKAACLKLAHTRLETRTRRAGADLCRDQVQHGLVAEVQQLEATSLNLKLQLSQNQGSLQRMALHRSRLLQDLSRKQEALSLEERSLAVRTRLTPASGTASGSASGTAYGPAARTGPLLLMNSSGRSHGNLLAQ